MHSFLAKPWLFHSYHVYNIPLFRSALSLGGFFLAGYLLLRTFETLINVLLGRYDKDSNFLLPILIALCAYALISGLPPSFSPTSNRPQPSPLSVRLLQANHSHLIPKNSYLAWEDYLHMIHPASQNSLNITAEGAISFSSKEISLSNFREFEFLKNSLIGINFVAGEHFTPMIIGANRAHGAYQKHHLVPFGEYFPLPNWVMQHFGYYNSHRMAQQLHTETKTLTYNHYHFYPLICYDLFFPMSTLSAIEKSDAIVAIAENTWYRDSIFQSMFLRAAKTRALEAQRPVLLALNRGPSSHVSHDGTVIKQIGYDTAGVLETNILPISSKPWHVTFSLTPTISMLLIFVFESIGLLRSRKISRRWRQKSL